MTTKNKKIRISPTEALIYNRVKFFTEKKELKCCIEGNDKLSDMFNVVPETISRAISKLKREGYIKENKKYSGRALESTKKEFNYNYNINNLDNEVKVIDNWVNTIDNGVNLDDKLVKLKSLLIDNQVIEALTIGSTGIDNWVNHIKDILKIDIKELYSIKKKINKKEYGEFKNVLLTDEEYQKLSNLYSNKLNEALEILSVWKKNKNKKTTHNYGTLLKTQWIYKKVFDGKEEQPQGLRRNL
jgi:DNA-binding transcriptional regulator YhcF (GntR family)